VNAYSLLNLNFVVSMVTSVKPHISRLCNSLKKQK